MRAFLLEILSVDERLANVFMQRFGDVDAKEACRMLADQIREAVYECSRGGFIDWRSAMQFERAWNRIVGSSLDALIERGAYGIALEVSFEALASIQDLDIDDSDGFTGDAVANVREYWQKLLELGDNEFTLHMYDRIRSFADYDELADDYDVLDMEVEMAEDFLVDSFADMPEFAGPTKEVALEQIALVRVVGDQAQDELRQLREQLCDPHAPIEGIAYGDPRYRLNNDAQFAVRRIQNHVTELGTWTLVLLRAMRAEGASESQLWDAAKEAIASEDVCMFFVRPALEAGDKDAALKVLLACKRACEELGDGQYPTGVSQQLADLLEGRDIPAMREELLYQMRRQGSRTAFERGLPTESLWERLRASYDAATWANVRMDILDSLGDGSVRRDCLAAEGLYNMLMDEAEAAGLFALGKHEAALAERHPERVLTLHLRELEDNPRYPGSNRKGYQQFCQRLVHIKALPGGEAAVQKIVEQTRLKYPRRPALLDELSHV